MALIVEKYGGTSIGSIERIAAVADGIADSDRRRDGLVVVVSAMSGETNRLTALAHQVNPTPPAREMDVLLATGEQVTIALLSMALAKRGVAARSYTGGQVQIRTDAVYGKARIVEINDARVRNDLAAGRVVVVAGFQGVDEDSNITTLGRGGSDTTAVAMAAALGADECCIYTDVDGVYTADPRVVADARRLDRITFEEMLELASLGSKVLQTRAVEFAGKYKVPLRVLSAFTPGPGTLISYEENSVEQPLISGITYNRDEAKLSIRGIPDEPGIAYRVLGPVSDAHINVDVILQNVGEDGLANLTFTIHRNDYRLAREILERIAGELGAQRIDGDGSIAKISVVGVGMRSHAGVATRMFRCLAEEGINIQMIATSEIKISVVVDDRHVELAVQALHKTFGLEHAQQATFPNV